MIKKNKNKLLFALLIICLADNIVLALTTYFSNLLHYTLFFICAPMLYLPAWIMLFRKETFRGFIFTSITVNLLLFIFDSGILGKGREFVLYIPVVISYFVFIPFEYKRLRILAVSVSLTILSLSTFTNLTPKLKIEVYDVLNTHINVLATLNMFTALISTILLLHYLIVDNNQITKDISDINEKLKESEFRLEFALNFSLDGIWDWDIEKNSVFFSEKWKKQLGYKPFEVENHFNSWLNLLHPDDKETALASLFNYIEGKTSTYSCIQRLRAKEGSYRWILDRGAIAKRDKSGKPIRMIGTHRDLTEKIEAEKEREKTEQMLISFNKNLSEGIYRSTPNKGLVYTNDAFAKLFGYNNSQEILSADSDSLYQFPEDRSRLQSEIFRFNSFSNQEVLFKRKDNSTFWGLVSSTRNLDNDGNEYYDGAIRDITQIKETETRLIEAKEATESALQAKNLFLSTISHEIRTPLNAISGLVEYLIQTKPRNDQQESIETLAFTVKHLNALTNNMIDFAATSIEHKELEPIKEVFLLTKLVDHICNSFSLESKKKKITIYRRYDPRLKDLVLGYPTALSQVLNNLLSNSLKFTDKGHIIVSYELVSLEAKIASVKFCVEDTGIGIDKSKQSVIFESFSQADNTIKRKYGGTGLGLAICKKILSRLDSDIYVESEPNKGSIFFFNISLECEKRENFTASHDSKKLIANPGNSSATEPRVLVVDDNPVNIFVFKKHLQLSGISFKSATSGDECIEILQTFHPKLVFLDIHMPGIDGIETCKIIRQQHPDIVIAGLTADISPATKQEALKAGMHSVFYKPFNPSEIIEYIKATGQKHLLAAGI